MKSQVLHTVWSIISAGEAAGEMWNWSLLGVTGLNLSFIDLAQRFSGIDNLLLPMLGTMLTTDASFYDHVQQRSQLVIATCDLGEKGNRKKIKRVLNSFERV